MTRSVTQASTDPLASAAVRVIDTMLQEHAEPGAPEPSHCFDVGDGVAGVVELWGGAIGAIAVHFPRPVAERIVALATGRPAAFGTTGFGDTIAELTEMIVVGARNALGEGEVGVSRPRVVYEGSLTPPAPATARPIWTDSGTFVIWTALHTPDAAGGRT